MPIGVACDDKVYRVGIEKVDPLYSSASGCRVLYLVAVAVVVVYEPLGCGTGVNILDVGVASFMLTGFD